ISSDEAVETAKQLALQEGLLQLLLSRLERDLRMQENLLRLCFLALVSDTCRPFFSSQSGKSVRQCKLSREKVEIIGFAY
nr:O-acetylserine (thiol) lyase isoform C [Tanacetum cinerariifolium]